MHLDRGHPADVPLDEEVEVGEDDEGWSQGGPGVILHDQLVALELPVHVAVLLHLVEGVAVEGSGGVTGGHWNSVETPLNPPKDRISVLGILDHVN